MTNFQKLKQAYTQAGWIKENTFRNTDELANAAADIQRLIAEFMVDNEPKKKGIFNLWDYAATDEIRPVMNGIFHDKERGYAVATDAHILVADKDLYDATLADPIDFKSEEPTKGRRPIDMYGKFIEGRYPNWSSVIPEKSEMYKTYHVSPEELDAYIKKCNAYMKLNGFTGRNAMKILFNVPGTDCWFYAPLLRLFLIATGGEINLSSPDKAAAYWGERRTAIVMPMLMEERDKKACDRGDGMYMR